MLSIDIFDQYFGLTGLVLDAGASFLIALIVGFIIKKHGIVNGLFLGISNLFICIVSLTGCNWLYCW
jgi:uncharacterized membrane protein (Fun14 family)